LLPVVIQYIVALIGVGGTGKFVFDLFSARSQGKKVNTENTVMLVNSATGYADKVVERLDKVTADFEAFRREQEGRNRAQEARNRMDDRLKVVHSQWDNRAASEIRSLGGHIEDPPPLFLSEGIA
jgi:hypothetical protein